MIWWHHQVSKQRWAEGLRSHFIVAPKLGPGGHPGAPWKVMEGGTSKCRFVKCIITRALNIYLAVPSDGEEGSEYLQRLNRWLSQYHSSVHRWSLWMMSTNCLVGPLDAWGGGAMVSSVGVLPFFFFTHWNCYVNLCLAFFKLWRSSYFKKKVFWWHLSKSLFSLLHPQYGPPSHGDQSWAPRPEKEGCVCSSLHVSFLLSLCSPSSAVSLRQ